MLKISYKIIRRIILIWQKIRVHYYKSFQNAVDITGNPISWQPLLITGNGRVKFKGKVQIGYFPSPYFFNGSTYFDLKGNNSLIEIEDGTVINNNSVIIADGASVSIGKKCLIGTYFSAVTSDFHNIDPEKRDSGDFPRIDVVIEDNVFIGNNVSILKGVTVGENSVIGTGSVVVSDIPENVIAAGVPCKVIRHLSDNDLIDKPDEPIVEHLELPTVPKLSV